MPLKKEKRLTLAGIELAISMDARRVERLKGSKPYRYGLRPTLQMLRGVASAGNAFGSLARRNGHASAPLDRVQSRPALGSDAEVMALRTGASLSPAADALRQRVATLEWYHTIELPHGVVTPGFVDHRGQVPLYGLPESLAGKRCLDVATFDGFWAFEMERRGGEVVAIDVESWAQADVPRRLLREAAEFGSRRVTGPTFELARECLGSKVERHLISVYDLSAERLGTFDVAFVSDLLLHLRDPQRALENVYSVLRPGGYVIVAEPYNPDLEEIQGIAVTQFVAWLGITWWLPSTHVLRAMLEVAGFEPITEISRFQLICNNAAPIQKVVYKAVVGANHRNTGGT